MTVLSPGVPAADDEPLRVDDVVRRHVAGEETAALVTAIRRAARVEFDLSEEMIDELREARIPETLLEAMRERQAHDARRRRALASQQEPPELPAEAVGRVVIRLNPGAVKPKERRITVYDQRDPRHERPWQTGDERYLDLALFVGCVTPDHVPDHWSMHTRLSNRYRPLPRHRLMSFVAGARWGRSRLLRRSIERADHSDAGAAVVPPADRDRLGLLELELPATLEFEAAQGVEHDLLFGLAVETENGFALWQAAEIRGVTTGTTPVELEAVARVSGSSLAGLSIEFEDPARPEQPVEVEE